MPLAQSVHSTLPDPAENVPGKHGVSDSDRWFGTALPEEASWHELCPGSGWKLPALQFVHSVPPEPAENVPGAHAISFAEPIIGTMLPEYEVRTRSIDSPNEASWHVVDPSSGANVPKSHSVHSLAPSPAEKLPAAHSYCLVEPVTFTNEPAEARSQLVAPRMSEKLPKSHGSHSLAPLSEKLPALHIIVTLSPMPTLSIVAAVVLLATKPTLASTSIVAFWKAA